MNGFAIKETPKQMLHGFKTLLFDPAGVMGLGGTLILTITSFMQGLPGYISATAGAILILVSGWQKIQVTRRQNAAARRAQELHDERQRILQRVEAKTLDMELAGFMLKHLEEDK